MGTPEAQLIKAGTEVVTEPTKEFLTKVAGTPGAELGEILGDRLRLRRWKNAIRLAEKAREFAAERGIDPHAVPLPTLFPILERGSLEEEEGMADRWAALLANAAADPDSVPPSFPGILEQLAPIEAAILEAIHHAVIVEPSAEGGQPWQLTTISAAGIQTRFSLTEAEYIGRVENLLRLRLVGPPATRLEFIDNPERVFLLEGTDQIRLTELGRAFVEACQRPGAPA